MAQILGGQVKEEWRIIESAPNFAISNYGEVVYQRTGVAQRPSQNAQGVLKVSMHIDGRVTSRSVAVMVADAFLTEPYPEWFNSVIHLDGDRRNCRADNLARRSRSFTIQYHRQFQDPAYIEQQRFLDSHYYLPDEDYHFETVKEVVVTYGALATETFVRVSQGRPLFPSGVRLEFAKN